MMFADRLKKWRGVKGRGKSARGKISQVQAAAALGVPLRTYQDWEFGRHEPSGYALGLLTQRTAKPWSEKDAGRPVAPSNRKAKGTPTGIGTGDRKSNHAKQKNKRKSRAR